MITDEELKVPYKLQDVWYKRAEQIPWLSFPASWEVKVIPPVTGATIRFRVRKRKDDWSTNEARGVSVYLDFDHALGYFGVDMDKPEPYWEIYPAIDGDIRRFAMADVEALLGAIALALESR